MLLVHHNAPSLSELSIQQAAIVVYIVLMVSFLLFSREDEDENEKKQIIFHSHLHTLIIMLFALYFDCCYVLQAASMEHNILSEARDPFVMFIHIYMAGCRSNDDYWLKEDVFGEEMRKTTELHM